MSVWKKVKSDALGRNVDESILDSALASMGLGLDKTVKPLTEEQKNKNIKTLITYFSSDVPAKVYSSKVELEPIEKLKALLAAYPVKKITPEILAMLENILLIENDVENAVDANSIEEKEDRIAVWKGDITKIKADVC